MEYTEGKWWVDVHDTSTTIEAVSQTICTDVSNCDAHLIAAAPAMHEALREIRQIVSDSAYRQSTREQVIAGKCFVALAQADKGE